jgi:hypothetical protein
MIYSKMNIFLLFFANLVGFTKKPGETGEGGKAPQLVCKRKNPAAWKGE